MIITSTVIIQTTSSFNITQMLCHFCNLCSKEHGNGKVCNRAQYGHRTFCNYVYYAFYSDTVSIVDKHFHSIDKTIVECTSAKYKVNIK